ncbi:hypothetical protein PsorP6_016116 [Peronosclerospora sorghi]|uniref:Uncharacterized protein n=1 Tax=Peronosclerospora sorghi TaxID=230839 RepID=A0ACC0VNG2_9STRA|nr:hypothetical protein PsorP6_016116 [Peronosclerospora sorghi]
MKPPPTLPSPLSNVDITKAKALARRPPFKTQLAEKLASGTIFSGPSDTLVSFWSRGDRLESLWRGFLCPSDPSKPWFINSQTQALNFINSALYALTKDTSATHFIRALGNHEGRGVVVLQEILDLTYSIDAGTRRDVVSFQRGFVPFVTMFTMRRMDMMSQHLDEANYVYAFVRTVAVQVFQTYLDHLTQLVERQDLDDRTFSHAAFLCDAEGRRYAPLCFTQVCLPLLRLVYVLGRKFKDFVYQDTFQGTTDRLEALVRAWREHAPEANAALDSRLCFQTITEELHRLDKMLRRRDLEVQAGAASDTTKRPRGEPAEPDVWNVLEVGRPAAAVFADGRVGPRHDNDHLEIRDIQVLPTTDECLAREPRVLPGNFPFHAKAHWLPPGPERWVDTHFRLYREDLCSTIRSGLQDLCHRLAARGGQDVTGRLRTADVDYNVYPVLETKMPLKHTPSQQEREGRQRLERHGLCIDVRLPQPWTGDLTGRAKTTSTRTRKEWWDKTNRLPFHGMVALVLEVTGDVKIVFCHIVERELERLVQDVVEITLQPLEARDFSTLESWRPTASTRNERRLLVEFNKVFLIAYEPVLRALQALEPATLPFLEYLAPETLPTERRIECPIYCFADGFRFDLSSVIRTHSAGVDGAPAQLRLDPMTNASRDECMATLVRYSKLEPDQAVALVEALSSRVACIQGLPGSGKSFLGALLTRILVEAKVSPILVVCYTNHALDQFLCHLLDCGITSLVRIGGRCKEPRLEKFNLNALPKTYDRYELRRLYQVLDDKASVIASVLHDLDAETRRPTWKGLKWFLETNYPDVYDQFADRSSYLFDNDWEVAGYSDIVDYWVQGQGLERQPFCALHTNARPTPNVWHWSRRERQDELAQWMREIRRDRVDMLVQAQEAYWETKKKIETVKEQADVDVLERVQIIGMTTTGVAKHQQKLATVAPPVVICEEAGEVLEAQLMACLSPACQHLVLIGDHQQLRPHIADYNLSVESAEGQRFALDVSLFERLVAPASGLPFWKLTEQHRMRPELSELLRKLFYPSLRDAHETLEYPPVLGLDQNLFFVTHEHPEDGQSEILGASARSHSNEYEVEYVVATLKYLLQQGYHTNEIALLTPYVGQLLKLRSALREQFVLELNELDLEEIHRTFDEADDEVDDDEMASDPVATSSARKKELAGVIRAATIDNFQGEEATIILASLVRSSTAKKRGTIGFLKTPNRINVLLSRAKHGLVMVGHGALLRENSRYWRQVLEHLERVGGYGTGLPLHCQRHPHYQREAQTPRSFALLAPDGGCLRPCGQRLPTCGHACPKLCHVDHVSHTSIYCTQPCPRLHAGCQHVCHKVCGDPCGRCDVLVGTISLPCGHTYRTARCYEAKIPSKVKCQALVDKIDTRCGHVQRVLCSTKTIKCTVPCGVIQACGHACARKCSDCVERTLLDDRERAFPIVPTEHGACEKVCDRMLPCSHRCQGKCHGDGPCPPCERMCDVFRCEHGACRHPCNEPCAACTEACSWSCDHCGPCPLPCGAPCTRRLCDRRCTQHLACGHQCPSVCGEECPSPAFCHVCGDNIVQERVVDLLLFQTYAEINPSDNPVLILRCCSMIYTMETLDGTLHLSTLYTKEGQPCGPLPSGYLDPPHCPNCNDVIRGLRRYGRVTKRAAIDAADKKFIAHAQRQLGRLQERTTAVRERGSFTQDPTLRHELRVFGGLVKKPPCQKVYEASVAVLIKARAGQGERTLDTSAVSVPNSAFPFLGSFYHLSAQLSVVCARNPKYLARAVEYARQAIAEFSKGSFLIQTKEAQVLLVQLLVKTIEGELNATVKTEQERKERERSVERRAAEANDVLTKLTNASIVSKYHNELQRLHETLVQYVRQAQSATFYQQVAVSEMKAIKMAMQTELRGTGHWYRCENGHSYAIGECGMAMEQSRCPECGVLVGGTNHSFVEGTVRDMQMDAL